MANLSIIVAFDQNHLIGKDNHLPWHIREDLKYFREVTMGHPVVMGRKTWLTLGKPLEGRTNIILTHDPDFQIPGCVTVHSVDQVISAYTDDEVFIIGGAEAFKQFLPHTSKIYLTRIQKAYSGDTYFPELNWAEWEMEFYEQIVTEEGIPISFERWLRKSPPSSQNKL